MSHNQSRGEKTEPHLRKPGRSGVAGQTRGFPGGGGGRGGGGSFAAPVPSPAPSDAPGRSFRKPGNVQGGQPRGQPTASPQAGVNALSAAGNGPQSQPPFQVPGIHDAPMPMARKPVEVSAPKPSRAVPRPPSGPGDSTASAGKGDASKPFTLQFGSITPGFVNGMPIPARTSSAPPNLDEQKRDQASHGMYGVSSSTIPVSSVLKQQSHLPHKEVIGPGPASSGNSHPTLEVKKDNTAQVSTLLPMPSQKSSGVSVPGMSMPMFQQQPQMPLQFGGPNITMQSQHVTASSMQMPMPQMPMASSPQMFVPGIQPHVVLQGPGLGFPTHMGHRMPSTLGNVGMGMGTQYSQQQTGQFVASRKTPVKITHPVTHEELRLDKKTDSHIDTSGQRSNIPPQSQPLSFPTPQINIFQNPQGTYATGHYYSSLPPGSSQPAVSQAQRYNYAVAQSGTPVSIVNPSTLTSVSVSKPGMTIQKDSEQSHVGQSQGGKVLSISAPAPVQLTVKAAVSITPDVGTTPAGPAAAVVNDGGSRAEKPSQEASLMSQQKVSAVGSEVPGGHLKGREAESEVADGHLNSSVKSTGASPIPTDNQLPELASSVDQKTEPHITTQASTLVIESINSSHLNIVRKELLISESLKNDKKKPEIVVQRHLEQEQMEDTLDSSSSSNVLSSSLLKESSSSASTNKRAQEYSEDINLVSETNETPKDSCVSLNVDAGSSECGASKGDIAHITPDHLGLPEVDSGLKDADGKPLSLHPMTNGAIPSEESTTDDFGVTIPCQESDSQLDVKKCLETLEVVETSESAANDTSFHGSKGERGMASLLKPSHRNDLLPDVSEEDISKQMIAPEDLGADGNLKDANGELAGVRLKNNGEMKEDAESKIQSVSAVDSSSNLSVHEAKTENIPESNVTTVNSPRPLLHSVVSDSDSSNKNQIVEEKIIEAGGQASRSSLMVKDKSASEASRAKTTTGRKKKKKEILLRADAAGTNSDLYMAYKKPEEQQVPSAPSDVTDCSSVDDGKKLQADEMEDINTKEDGQSKTDIDDWEDAVEIPSPKLEATEKSGRYNIAKKLGHEFGVVSSRKKYSRDFLLTFSDQCTDLPTGLEIGPDVAPLFSAQAGASHLLNNEMLLGHARIIDRPNPTNRTDRRVMNYMDDEKWTKATNLSSSRDGGFRAGPGATHGVLRNPRGQGGILPGQMQPLAAQGVPRSNIDAERWQRASSLRGLMPSPQTPAQVMHKAERKYEVGKVSDDEEAKQRQIKAILNKLTPQNFDRLFQQVKEVNIDSAVTLTRVISQIFDKALAEPTFCEMYANFCLDLAGALPDFIEGNEKITFKRLLLNKCQEEFERGEREQAEADRVEEEGEVKQSEEQKEEMRIKARRRMLGNIRLIGELYKKRMLTERIMHDCIKKLLGQDQNPDEEDIEALCKLMSTIGEMIDHVRAKEHMDAYFDIMKNLSLNQKLSSRVRFMLKDAIDLRKNNWQQRRKVEGPKKIEEVHRDAAQERAHAGRSVRGSGIGSSIRKGPPPVDYGSRNSMPPSSGVPQAASLRSIPAQVRGFGSQDVRMDDKYLYESRTLSVPLSQRPLGDDSITLGPQGGLAKGMSSRGQPLMPHPPIADVSSTGESSRRMVLGPNGHSSISDRNVYIGIRDLGKAERNYDRSTSKTSLEQNLGSSAGSAGTSPQSVSFLEEQLRDKAISAIREYYSAKDEKEIGLCIKELNSPGFYPTMVSLWVTDSFERNNIERVLLAKLLVSLCKPGDRLLSREQLIQGFELVLSTLEDVVTDAPRAPEFVGRIFVRSILEDVVTFQEIGRLLHEGGEQPGSLREIGLAADVLGSILETIKAEKGDATMKELRMSCSLPLESFRPPLPMKSSKLEQFLRDVVSRPASSN